MKQQNEDLIYRVYITDCLKTIAENTAKINGGNVIGTRYYDMIKPTENNVKEKSAEEIISDINRKLAQIRGEKNG